MNEIVVNGKYKDSKGNIVISPNKLLNVVVDFQGENNFLLINQNAKNIKNLRIDFKGNNGRVLLGDNNISGTVAVFDKSTIIIGDNIVSDFPVDFCCQQNTKIIIGDECFLGMNTKVYTGDSYSIYDVITNKCHNEAKDVVIGAHVLIDNNVMIHGGALIGHGSIIGSNSTINTKFLNNSLVSGNPAILLKKNITWIKDKNIKKNNINKNLYRDKTDRTANIFLGDGCSHLLNYIENVAFLKTDKEYFDIEKISLVDMELSIVGHAFLRGIECYDFGETYQYFLLLQNDNKKVEIALGKLSDMEISKKVFDGRHISYQKSKFVMKKNKPLDLSQIDKGEYKVFIKMKAKTDDYIFNVADFLDLKNLEINSSDALLSVINDFVILSI